MAATMPLTLLTLPLEIRQIIWDYCLVSPTRRVLPVYYNAEDRSSILYGPYVWLPICDLLQSCGETYAAARRTAFSKILYLIPCAPTTATPLSLSLFPLANYLPRVNRQIYVETSTRLWSKNTIVFPDHHTAKELFEYLKKVSLGAQCVEVVIGNVWDLRSNVLPEKMTKTLNELLRLVNEGRLAKLRLHYFDGGAYNVTAFNAWCSVLYKNGRSSDWGGCEREVVWEEENKMETDNLGLALARQGGLEGGCVWDEGWDEWDSSITNPYWVPAMGWESEV